jgi:uncharacterized cupin superfamily protein
LHKIDIAALPVRSGTIYPPSCAAEVAGRSSLRLGDAGGLTRFGVDIVILAPGAKSSMRHRHEAEDEFVMIPDGICTMVTNDGPADMRPCDCVAFPAGTPDGHHSVNHSGAEARFLVVGSKVRRGVAQDPDQGIKVTMEGGRARFTAEDGGPLPTP